MLPAVDSRIAALLGSFDRIRQYCAGPVIDKVEDEVSCPETRRTGFDNPLKLTEWAAIVRKVGTSPQSVESRREQGAAQILVASDTRPRAAGPRQEQGRAPRLQPPAGRPTPPAQSLIRVKLVLLGATVSSCRLADH